MMSATSSARAVRPATNRTVWFVSASVLAVVFAASAAADVVIWDEAIDGDLSNDQFAPTPITLDFGVSNLLATSVQGDREYVAITIQDGMFLTHLRLISYAGLDDTAFIGVQEGDTMTEPPTGTNVANLLGWSHFGPGAGNLGTNILDDIGIGAGAIGFIPPLDAGTYTFWIQQTGLNAASYRFDFIVIPAPGAAAMLAAVALIGPRRRRSLL